MLRLHSKHQPVRIKAQTGAVQAKRMFASAVSGDNLEMMIYDAIGGDGWSGGVTADDIKQLLDDAGDVKTITVRINSPGGNVFQAAAIYSLLSQHKANVEVYVDGVAASAAFTIAMAGDKVHMSRAAMMMLHNSLGVCMGHSSDMRAMADVLDEVSDVMAGIYSERSGMDKDECKAMMNGPNRDGTWLTPEKAIEHGFADDIVQRTDAEDAQARAIAAQFDLKKFGIKAAAADPTKRVDGEALPKSAFAYQGSDDRKDWKLAIKFSSADKTKRHITNHLARWAETSMPNAEEKTKARDRILAAAKAIGITVDADALKDEAAPPPPAAEEVLSVEECECSCANCQAGDCSNCTDTACADEACAAAGCPNQGEGGETNDEVDAQTVDVATLRAKFAILAL